MQTQPGTDVDPRNAQDAAVRADLAHYAAMSQPSATDAPSPPPAAVADDQPQPTAADSPPAPRRSVEIGGPSGLEPTRFGDWEKAGRCIDF